jgi:anaerobic ribonucleoside-triphosphate reductase
MNLKTIFKAWVISFNPTKEQADLAKKRTDICNKCEFLTITLTIPTCSECGCPIGKKVFTDSFNPCPKLKWESVDLAHYKKHKIITNKKGLI